VVEETSVLKQTPLNKRRGKPASPTKSTPAKKVTRGKKASPVKAESPTKATPAKKVTRGKKASPVKATTVVEETTVLKQVPVKKGGKRKAVSPIQVSMTPKVSKEINGFCDFS
jgi:hypothetical protein